MDGVHPLECSNPFIETTVYFVLISRNSGMGEKARRAKERLVSGLKNFTKRFSLDSGTIPLMF